MIQGMFEIGALPVAERLVQFTAQRHRVLADNIANLSTPYFKPRDLGVQAFQNSLQRAIDRRRDGSRSDGAALSPRDTRDVRFEAGRLEVRPRPTHDNVLFHDQNNRDLDRLMARLAENTLAHNVGVELIRNQFQMLATAIRERV